MKPRYRPAFTLIEVLIVVVIMAVLAATIIPQFSSSTKDAQDSAARFNAHTMRAQIELYKAQHFGTLPTVANLATQLTKPTNASGAVSTSTSASTDYPFGPYMDSIPTNPFNNLNTIASGTGGTGSGAGWQYDATTGGVWPDHKGYTGTTTTATTTTTGN